MQKRVFRTIFFLLVVFILILPFLVIFNEWLTAVIEHIRVYSWVQSHIVPYEVGMVQTLVSFFGVTFVAYANGMLVKGKFLEMTWNCIGWQSLLLLTITLIVGLKSGTYTTMSKFEVIAIGILGMFLMNLLRLTLIVLIYVYATPIYFYVYHDYLSAIFTVIWLFVFWWFSYRFVLEEKSSDLRSRDSAQPVG